MAPHPSVAPPAEEAEQDTLEQVHGTWPEPEGPSRGTQPQAGPPTASGSTFPEQMPAGRIPPTRVWLAEALLEQSPTRPGRRTWDLFLSLLLHAIFIATLILIPLYFTEAIDLKQFTQTFLLAPPPPPPPPPPASPMIAKVSSAPKRIFTSGGKLLAPTAIPEKVAMLKEEALPPDVEVVGGVPGGVPGGQVSRSQHFTTGYPHLLC